MTFSVIPVLFSPRCFVYYCFHWHDSTSRRSQSSCSSTISPPVTPFLFLFFFFFLPSRPVHGRRRTNNNNKTPPLRRRAVCVSLCDGRWWWRAVVGGRLCRVVCVPRTTLTGVSCTTWSSYTAREFGKRLRVPPNRTVCACPAAGAAAAHRHHNYIVLYGETSRAAAPADWFRIYTAGSCVCVSFLTRHIYNNMLII